MRKQRRLGQQKQGVAPGRCWDPSQQLLTYSREGTLGTERLSYHILAKKPKSYTPEPESRNGIRYQEEEFSGDKGCIWQRAFHMWHQQSLGPFLCLSHQAYHHHRCLNILIICTESQVQSERSYVKTLVSHTWAGQIALLANTE